MHTPDSGADYARHTPRHEPLQDDVHGLICGEDGERWPCSVAPVTADVQRELADDRDQMAAIWDQLRASDVPAREANRLTKALLPTVQRLIADAEKRAAAAALRDAADDWELRGLTLTAQELRTLAARAEALDPAGAASGETT